MFRKSSNGWLKHIDFIILDVICLQISFVFAYMMRHGVQNPYEDTIYLNMAIVLLLIDVVVIFFYETFRGVLKRGYFQEFAITVKHSFLIEGVSALYLFTIKNGDAYSRTVLYTMGFIYLFLTYLVRIFWKKRLNRIMKRGGPRSLFIVTTSAAAQQVIENIEKNNYEMFSIVGIALTDCDKVGQKIVDVPVVSTAATAADYVSKQWVDEVFISLEDEQIHSKDLIDQFMEMGVTVHRSLGRLVNAKGKKQLLGRVGNYTVLTTSMNYATSKQAFMKRSMDILGGLVGCILTFIIFIFIAPIIFIHSPGPIFFSQVRIGKNGKPFKMYKFRSMYLDAEERQKELMEKNRVKDGRMFKLDFDPRIIGNKELPNGERKTGIGEFIRRTSLDEFPQFFNVLKGDMSLIGTRPPLVQEVEQYERHHCVRLAVKPGLTGMWQVSGRSNITDFEEVVKLDAEYINEWSMGLDIKILFKTILVVLKKQGSM